MEMSTWIAKLLGPVILVTATPMVLSPKTIHTLATDFLKSLPLIYITGVLVLVGGLSIVNAHNRWNLDWTVFITIFGWAMIIGGAARVAVPTIVVRVGTAMMGGPTTIRLTGALWGLIGALLTYKGYDW